MSTSSPVDWSRASVFVTGATGFVGSQLVHRLIELGANVMCFVRDNDPVSALWMDGFVDRISIVNGRLEVYEQIKTAIVERAPDTIFHIGAQAIVGIGNCDPLGTFESNIRGTYNLLEACRIYGSQLKRIIVASSDKAYGDCPTLPYTEETALAAQNPYDVSKSCADLIAQSYYHSYRLPIAIARCGNIFGPGDLHWNRLVPGTIRSLLQGEAPRIRSNGKLVRDYLYINDAVSAYICLAEWLSCDDNESDRQRAFNFSTNQPMSVLEMTRLIQLACGRCDLEPIVLDNSSGEIAAQHLDSNRARRLLQWRCMHDLDSALLHTVNWYREYLSRFDAPCHTLALPTPPELRRASA